MGASTGWRRDPFGTHEWRYFLDGEPTPSVGDAGLMSEDPPPSQEAATVEASTQRALVGGQALAGTQMEPASTPTDRRRASAVPSGPQEAARLRLGEPETSLENRPRTGLGDSGATDGGADGKERSVEAPGVWTEALRRWLIAASPLLGIYLCVRIGLLAADVLSAHVGYGSALSGPLLAWDAHWYVLIAGHGYAAHPPMAHGQLTYSAANFLPFFPLLVRAVQQIGFSPVIAASIVSWVSGAVATVLVWRLGAMAFDEATGRLAALLFMVFPGMGIAWGALYSECVGLALVAGCLLLLMRGGGGAGLLGMFATLTSPMAVVPLTVAAAVATVQARRRGRSLAAPLSAVVLTPAGFVGYAVWIGNRYHDLFYYWHLGHQVWGTSIDFGDSLLHVLFHPLTQGFLGPGWLNWIGLAAVVAALVVLARFRLPSILAGYSLTVFLQLAMTNVLGFRPRNLTWAFPALIAVAAASRRRAWQPVAIGFAMLLPVAFLAYTTIGNTMGAP